MNHNTDAELKVSKHHLFTREDIRAKLIEILGEPRTNKERKRLETELNIAWKAMPVYTIDHQLHLRIHKRQQLRKAMKVQNESNTESTDISTWDI